MRTACGLVSSPQCSSSTFSEPLFGAAKQLFRLRFRLFVEGDSRPPFHKGGPMEIYFADVCFAPGRRELSCSRGIVHLHALGLRLLRYLIEHRARAVSKDDLIRDVWSQSVVSDAAISRAVADVRRAIGDSGRDQKFIRTLHGFGYRFVAVVGEGAIPSSPVIGDGFGSSRILEQWDEPTAVAQ